MQIELIGCTSAGKSTLAAGIVQACRQQGLEIFLAEDFVLRQLRLNWIRSVLLRKFLVNLVALFASMVTWPKNRKLYLFAIQVLFQLPISRLESVSLFRNVLKKVGIGELVRARSTDQQIILLDEGDLHIAHNLYVHVNATPNTDSIPAFVELLRLPDVVIYLRPPESTLVERIMKRGHRRIADPSDGSVACFVRRAIVTFDKLVQEPAVANKLLVVDGLQQTATVVHEEDDRNIGFALGIIRTVEQRYAA